MFKFIRNTLVVQARMTYNLVVGIPAFISISKKIANDSAQPLDGLRELVNIMYAGVDRNAVVYNLDISAKMYQALARFANNFSQVATMFQNSADSTSSMTEVLKKNSGAISVDEMNTWFDLAMTQAAKSNFASN